MDKPIVERPMQPSVRARLATALRGADCAGPVPDEVIAAAESQLGIVFPSSYRQFLSSFGAALWSPIEIAGLISPPLLDGEQPTWTDMLKVTMSRRACASIPVRYLAVSHDGMDCAYYLDVSAVSEDGEGRVVALGPGRDFEFVAKSFVAFVELAAGGVAP